MKNHCFFEDYLWKIENDPSLELLKNELYNET